MFKLVIQDDEGKTTVVPLIRDEITIGRKEGNTIRLTERNVSRRHARIVRNNGEVQIEDLGSYNGIRVNNARIAERVSLRISDQVQIGDYKLYLKAEGVEQVDDARTMPIERVDTNTATDVMPAIPVPSTATMPTANAATNGLAAAPGSPQLVGNPARTLVAIADTDPAGRPVATAATIATLSAPVGYGKLVVLSANFAGKEFELSRPQMIIGRTDENDICINHRSISRNHAKLVREPETGRYTISDLQSSNGVRVNGQDYGKVELRRGDVIDLGHVRMRFVEPGEDFVFARDAVITDVPDGGKKGMLIAVLLGVLVLGAVIVFFVTRGGDKPDGGTGSNGMAAIPDAPEKVAVVTGSGSSGSTGSNDGSAEAGSNDGPDVQPTITPDAPEAGSAATNVNTNPPPNSELEQKCLDFQKAKEWSNLQTCANSLQATNPKRAAELNKRAVDEAKALTNSDKVTDAVTQENLDGAAAAMNKIPKDSVYHGDAKKKFDAYESKVLGDFRTKVRAAAADKNCKTVDQLVKQAPSRIQGELKKIQCEDRVAAGSNTVVTPQGCTTAQIDELQEKVTTGYRSSQHAVVMASVDKLFACNRVDVNQIQMAAMSACKAGNAAKAKSYFGRITIASRQAQVVVECSRSVPKITLP